LPVAQFLLAQNTTTLNACIALAMISEWQLSGLLSSMHEQRRQQT